MEGKTHYIGGSLGALVGFIALKENGMLLDNINPALQFSLIYPFAIYGGMVPDADHHAGSSPLRDPVGRVFNKALHVFNAPYNRMDEALSSNAKRNNLGYKLLRILKCTHRSWQTHSELTLLLLFYLLYQALTGDPTDPNNVILSLILTGFTIGVISHIILDMLTTDGIYFATGFFIKTLFPKVPIITTLRIVPKTSFFGTGTPYEKTVRAIINVLQFFALAYVLLQLMGYEVVFS